MQLSKINAFYVLLQHSGNLIHSMSVKVLMQVIVIQG